MNIYIFYYAPITEYKDPPMFYAFTDDKDMADEFKKQRDMEKFICTKEKCTKEEFKLFDRDHHCYKLTYGNFYTKGESLNKKIGVKVLCTVREEDSILKNSENLWQEYSKTLFDCKVFKSQYIQSLESLLFIKFYGFYKVKYLEYADYFYQPYYSNFGPPEGMIIEEFKDSFSYDELKLFLKFVKHTFSMKDNE